MVIAWRVAALARERKPGPESWKVFSEVENGYAT